VKSKGKKHAADSSAASSPTNPPHGKLAKADMADSEDDACPAAIVQSVQQHLSLEEGVSRSEAGKTLTLCWSPVLVAVACHSVWSV